MRNRVAAIWVSLILLFSFFVIYIDIAPVAKSAKIIYVDDVPGVGPGNPAENYTSIMAIQFLSITGLIMEVWISIKP